MGVGAYLCEKSMRVASPRRVVAIRSAREIRGSLTDAFTPAPEYNLCSVEASRGAYAYVAASRRPWGCLHRVANQDKGGEFINCCWWHIQLKYGYKSLNHSADTAGDLQSQVMKKHCNKESGEEKVCCLPLQGHVTCTPAASSSSILSILTILKYSMN